MDEQFNSIREERKAQLEPEPGSCSGSLAGVGLGDVLHTASTAPALMWILYLLPTLFGRVVAADGISRRGVADHTGMPNE